MTDIVYFTAGLSPLAGFGLLVLVFFLLSGVWYWLTEALEALNERLNAREYDEQWRAYEERQNKAWKDAQAAFKADRQDARVFGTIKRGVR